MNAEFEEEKVWNCLSKAGLENTVKGWEKGLDTILYYQFDEAGIEVSGGEEQKIAIARSIFKEAPIYILDEPTAALDPVSENEIFTKMNQITENKSVIFITHRLSSCCFSDRILVLGEGSILQCGRHYYTIKRGNTINYGMRKLSITKKEIRECYDTFLTIYKVFCCVVL